MSVPKKTLLLFGPQVPQLSPSSLLDLRNTIFSNDDFDFLRRIIMKLPSIWPVIEGAIPAMAKVAGEQKLIQLVEFLETGQIIQTKTASNILLATLTVVSQTVEYVQSATSPHDVQGFCIGFLTASVVSCAENRSELEDLIEKAICLAVCVGAVVDADEEALDPPQRSSTCSVYWPSEQEETYFWKVLQQFPKAFISSMTDVSRATVTLPIRDYDTFSQQLNDNGLSVLSVGICGRYHFSGRKDVMDDLKELCNKNPLFQLHSADRLKFPLRSTADGNVIRHGKLQDIALECILERQCQWYKTVKQALEAQPNDIVSLVSVGGQAAIPRSLVPGPAVTSPLNQGLLVNSTSIDTSMVGSGFCTPDTTNASAPAANANPIAVVGMACRYSQAESVQEFWDLIDSGRNAFGPLPPNRFQSEDLVREPKKQFWGNFLKDPEAFDHRFFKISSREAESMDPQQRLLLQVAYEAIESAGLASPSGQQPNDIGCYIGVGSVDYEANVASENATAFSATGTLRAFISGKVSHYFGWTGPSITIDTACSSSSVAIHHACKALQTNECSVAIAGGVNIITSPNLYQNLDAASFLSPTGASKAFDAKGDGYCRGEGAGVLVLKQLALAVKDNDPIVGIIAGSAVNQGSNQSSITVPDSMSQSNLYTKALRAAGILPEEVSYVEAHGTGTPVGDPIECESIRLAFGQSNRMQQLSIGSVKDVTGHTEAASGVAGCIKTLLMIQHKVIPRQPNFNQLNPKIGPLGPNNMTIADKRRQWKGDRRTAIVNNYGAAGSNAAIVIQEYCPDDYPESLQYIENLNSEANLTEYPVIITAKTVESLRSYSKALANGLRKPSNFDKAPKLANVAYNLAQKQNRTLDYISISTASSLSGLSNQLASVASGSTDVEKALSGPPPIVLCFGGQNGKTASISEDLARKSPLLWNHLERCDTVCKSLGLASLFEHVFDPSPIEDLPTLHATLFSVQYACARAWLDSGLEVATMVGHSFGQLTALCVAGCFDLSDGLRLVVNRARLIGKQWGPDPGVMISIEGDTKHLDEALSRFKDLGPSYYIDVACYNGPRNIVIAGDMKSMEKAESLCSESPHLKMTQLGNSHAYHSRLIDPILPGLVSTAELISWRQPSISVETCSQRQAWPDVNAELIVEHSRKPVYFSEAISRINQQYPSCLWLEVGSASPIMPMIQRLLPLPRRDALFRLDIGGQAAVNNLSKITSRLWASGSRTEFWPFHRKQNKGHQWLNLPPYQFSKVKHWINYRAPELKTPPAQFKLKSDLLQLVKNGNGEYLFEIDVSQPIFVLGVSGHAVLDQSLCPASMYFELAIRATDLIIHKNDSSGMVPRILGLRISYPLALNSAGQLFLKLEDAKDEFSWCFSLFTERHDQGVHQPIVHAQGTIALLKEEKAHTRFQSVRRLLGSSWYEDIAQSADSERLSGDVIYKVFGQVVNYKPYYRGVRNVIARGSDVVGDIRMPPPPPGVSSHGVSNPFTVDNILQVAGIHVNCLIPSKEHEVLVCTGIAEVHWNQSFWKTSTHQPKLMVYSSLGTSELNALETDIVALHPETGDVLMFLQGAQFTSVQISSLSKVLSKLNNTQSETPKPRTAYPHVGTNSWPDAKQQHKTNGVSLNASPTDNVSNISQRTDGTVGLVSGATPQSDIIGPLKQLLSDVLGVDIAEVQQSSSLSDLGVDSLMISEITSDINQRFQLTLSGSDLSDLTDVKSLSERLESMMQGTTRSPDSEGSLISAEIIDESVAVICNHWLSSHRAEYDEVLLQTNMDQFFDQVYPLQAQLVVAYVTEAFAQLGCDLRKVKPGEILPYFNYLPKHDKVVTQFFRVLQDAGLIVRNQEGIPERTTAHVNTATAGELHNRIVREYPQHAAEHHLLHTTGPLLADCLLGRADPLALLFKDAKAKRLLEDVYTNAPMFKAGTLFLARFLVDSFQRFGQQRPIRIIELGAGTGGTTSLLLEHIATTAQAFEYTFTDLSPSLVAAAKRIFGGRSFMRYQVLDIEKSPVDDLVGHFDIVISTNCIHATRNLELSTSHIRQLLRPDGILCLLELTKNLFWFDLVFGLLEGWWLFEDGRKHALASEIVWREKLFAAGYKSVTWSEGSMQESKILRMIVASPSAEACSSLPENAALPTTETVVMKDSGSLALQADIYYPPKLQRSHIARPIALMIHGGGHVMLSRKDVRPQQTSLLLDLGFIPVSIDYRLCPETSLEEGPMRDVCEALHWARTCLPSLALKRHDISISGEEVVAVGWSTGGHLALSLGWTAPQAGIRPPEAILAFYCPLDYEDSFWSRPNRPYNEEVTNDYDIWDGVRDAPITAYNPPAVLGASGGWMTKTDARSRIALHMNWHGQTLPILIHGLKNRKKVTKVGSTSILKLPNPTLKEIQSVSPLAQVRKGNYRTPTFIVHPVQDDLIPWQQAERTYDALVQNGIPADLRLVRNARHLFDLHAQYNKNTEARQAVYDGYSFLASHIKHK